MTRDLWGGLRGLSGLFERDGRDKDVGLLFEQGLGPAAVVRQVLGDVEDAGPRLFVAAELQHETADGRVLWERRKVRRVDTPAQVRHVRVLENDLVAEDGQRGGGRAGVLPVRDEVGDQLAEDAVAQADALGALQIEGVVQMLLDKPHEPVESVDQVGVEHQAVVVAVHVVTPQERVEDHGRRGLLDGGVAAEHKGGGKREAHVRGERVFADETSEAEDLLVRQVQPRVVFALGAEQVAGPIKQVGTQVRHAQSGQHALLGVETQFAVDQARDLVRVPDAVVAVLAAQIDLAARAVDLRAARHLDADDPLAVELFRMREQQVRGVELLRVVREIGDLDL